MTRFSQLLLLQIEIKLELNFPLHKQTSEMMIYVAVKAKI